MMRKACFIAAIVCFIFAAFGFAPFGNFHFGWMGLAVLAAALTL